jgi:hypothetical protein
MNYICNSRDGCIYSGAYILQLEVPVDPADLAGQITQLPPLFILLGDFVAKNILWD